MTTPNVSNSTDELDWAKVDGLLPAIVQDVDSGRVLMLGYMNEAALAQTRTQGRVTFFSRSRGTLWTKGETSGHFLDVVSIHVDCDRDTLLLIAKPNGPTCHRGCTTCFDPLDGPLVSELATLDAIVASRVRDKPEGSYTTKLLASGIRRVAQKVGEEGVETALAGVVQDDDALIDEAADLMYHLTVLMHARGRSMADVLARLRKRGQKR